jgi:hypothetical protein
MISIFQFHKVDPVRESAAYMHGMGTIVRCPSCDNALIRIVHAGGRYLLDMRGVRVLQIMEG